MPFEIHRIKWTPPSAFCEVNSKKAAPRSCGEKTFGISMGNPDTTPAPQIVDKPLEIASDPKIHRYSKTRGLPELLLANFKASVAPWYGFGEYVVRFVWFLLVEFEFSIRLAIFGVRRFRQDYKCLEIADSHAVMGQ